MERGHSFNVIIAQILPFVNVYNADCSSGVDFVGFFCNHLAMPKRIGYNGDIGVPSLKMEKDGVFMKKLIIALLLATFMLFGAAALAEGVVLPDPAYYFGKEYGFWGSYITFDEYPEVEFDAYTALLIEKYGMVITDTRIGDDEKSYMMSKPGIDGTKVSVSCIRESDSEQYIDFRFGENISLEKLDVYTASSACDLCGGDGLCDTCGGKGYLEMKAYGSNETVRIACTGGCTEGKCLSCAPDAATLDTKVYKAPIVGNDGLLVMSPEQYLGIKPCDRIDQQGNYYSYRYPKRGFEKYGDTREKCEDWYAMGDYVNALVDSGYYKVLEHTYNSNKETWSLGYTGSKPIKVFGANTASTQEAAIVIRSFFGDIRVSYSVDILTDDFEETQKRLGTDISITNNSDDNSIWKTCGSCNGDGKCTYCNGRGTELITGGDCAVCFGGRCSYCDGKGHE